MNARNIIAADLLAMFAFALLGLASHERDVSAAALARTFVPFAVSWMIVGTIVGLLRPDDHGRAPLGMRFLVAYLVAGAVALVARSLIFDRMLITAFFVIALAGNGLFLFTWRALAGRWLRYRSSSTQRREAAQS